MRPTLRKQSQFCFCRLRGRSDRGLDLADLRDGTGDAAAEGGRRRRAPRPVTPGMAGAHKGGGGDGGGRRQRRGRRGRRARGQEQDDLTLGHSADSSRRSAGDSSQVARLPKALRSGRRRIREAIQEQEEDTREAEAEVVVEALPDSWEEELDREDDDKEDATGKGHVYEYRFIAPSCSSCVFETD